MMANANVFAQFLKEPTSAMDYADKYAAADTARQQNAFNQLVMGEKVNAIGEQNRLRQLYQQNPNATSAQLRQAGFRDEAAKADAAALESRKTESDIGLKGAQTSKAQMEAQAKAADMAYEKIARHAQGVAAVQTPQDIVAYVDRGIAEGVPGFSPEMREQAIAKFQQLGSVDAWKKAATEGAIPVVDRFKQAAEDARQKASLDVQVRGQDVSATTQRRGQDISAQTTMRGQNMTDARTRESNSASMGKPFEVTGPDGLPILVRQDKQGNISKVEGFSPKTAPAKPLNDTQAKALLFGSRMQEAEKTLSGLTQDGVERPSVITQAARGVPVAGPVLGAISNTVVASPKQQQVEQAQRDFVNAVLRRESGAAISEGEFDNARKQYFPQIGDSEAVKKQKAANRQLATRGLLAEVPEAQRNSLSTPGAPSGATGGWSVSEVK